jgi:fructose/tagatose bisphosphate aldolase
MTMNFSRTDANKKLLLAKKANGCEECGYNKHPAALDLDHIDPDTKLVSATGRRVSPGSMLSYSTIMFQSELAKCRVLCKNCHAIHTVEQMAELRRLGRLKVRGKNIRKMSVAPDKVEVC